MGCCVLVMTLIAHFFAWRRKIRQTIGLPDDFADEAETESVPQFGEIWRDRFNKVTRSTAGRAAFAAVVLGELAFAAVALPGPDGAIATHREHFREIVRYVASLGHAVDASAFCIAPTVTATWTSPKTVGQPSPARPENRSGSGSVAVNR
jgi:hypothetical protein